MNATTSRIRRPLAALALAGAAIVGTTGTAHAVPVLDNSQASRTSLYSVSFSTTVTDPVGDPYCTQLTARIYDYDSNGNSRQIGSEVNYGTVCNNTYRFSGRTISTVQNRPIQLVMLTARRGVGGEAIAVWGRNF